MISLTIDFGIASEPVTHVRTRVSGAEKSKKQSLV